MSHLIQPATGNRQKIDAYVLSDESAYLDWQDLVSEATEELHTLDRYVNFFGLTNMAAGDRDADWLEHGVNQLGIAMALISNNKRVNREQLAAVQIVAEEALEALRLQNGAAAAVFAVNALVGYMEARLRTVEGRARDAASKLSLLKAALEEAKRQRNESIAQGLIDGLILVATVIQPELILLSGIKAAVGQKLMDDSFGGAKSSAAMDQWSTRSANGSVAQASLETFSFLMPAKTVPYIKAAGKPLAVVGLAFDANEIYTGIKNVASIRNAIDSLMPVLRLLQNDLATLQPQVLRLWQQARQVRIRVKDSRDEAEDHSREYRRVADQNQIFPGRMVQWKM